jgi:hypothetical protein
VSSDDENKAKGATRARLVGIQTETKHDVKGQLEDTFVRDHFSILSEIEGVGNKHCRLKLERTQAS